MFLLSDLDKMKENGLNSSECLQEIQVTDREQDGKRRLAPSVELEAVFA